MAGKKGWIPPIPPSYLQTDHPRPPDRCPWDHTQDPPRPKCPIPQRAMSMDPRPMPVRTRNTQDELKDESKSICFSAITVLSTHIKVSQLLLVKGEDYLTDYGQCDGNLRKKKNSE